MHCGQEVVVARGHKKRLKVKRVSVLVILTTTTTKCTSIIYSCLCGSLPESVQEGKGEIRYHIRQHGVCLQS
jgi:hypothetical protein